MSEIVQKRPTTIADQVLGQEAVNINSLEKPLSNLYSINDGKTPPDDTDFQGLEREFWCNWGIDLAKAQRYSEALTCFDRALAIELDNYSTWLWHGGVLTNLNRYEEAIASFEEALKIAPNGKEAWLYMGMALHHLGYYKKAYVCYDKALETKNNGILGKLMGVPGLMKRSIVRMLKSQGQSASPTA
jgi:superkiller protein 3